MSLAETETDYRLMISELEGRNSDDGETGTGGNVVNNTTVSDSKDHVLSGETWSGPLDR